MLYIGIECGCSSGVEHNLAKVGVEGSNPFARSKKFFPCFFQLDFFQIVRIFRSF